MGNDQWGYQPAVSKSANTLHLDAFPFAERLRVRRCEGAAAELRRKEQNDDLIGRVGRFKKCPESLISPVDKPNWSPVATHH